MADRRGPGPRGAGLLRLRERLELTDEQVARIESIRTELRQNTDAARERMRDVLTDAQRATLEEIRAERPRRGRRPR